MVGLPESFGTLDSALDFSASQSNLFDYTALASTEFDFGAASVYAELDGNLVRLQVLD